MAAENCLWGAPRIHCELLKLGIAVSERTVSRYLRGRLTTRSQTWRTFFANHFGGQTVISPVMAADPHDGNDAIDASEVSFTQLRCSECVVRLPFPGRLWIGLFAPGLVPSACASANITAVTLRNTCGCNQPRGAGAGFRSCTPAVPLRDRRQREIYLPREVGQGCHEPASVCKRVLNVVAAPIRRPVRRVFAM